jgi:outer membrane protein TolC
MVSRTAALIAACLLVAGLLHGGAAGQGVQPAPAASTAPACPPQTVLAINLPTALQLAGARPLDISLASQRLQAAAAQYERSRVLWLPTVTMGVDYYRHDGQLQDVAGEVFGTSKHALMAGVGPTAVFSVSEALLGPLAARQVVRAREAGLQAAVNDATLEVTEAYFNTQQARGELAAAEDVARRATELSRRADELGKALVPAVEAVRVRTELARRRQLAHQARQRYVSAGADLVRVLRLQPGSLVEPAEPPELKVPLVLPEQPLTDLIALALTARPELEANRALAEAAAERLRLERLRPLLPSLLVRGASTMPGGTLAMGVFGGGRNSSMGNFGYRGDIDVQVVWELQNMGLGNRALIRERRAEGEIATLEYLRTQDRVAAEVTRANAELSAARLRLADAEAAVKDAVESARLNLEGLGQTRRAGEAVLLVIRPQEAVASVQALAQAYSDLFATVADYNRAQFRLYRALGQPAQALSGAVGPCAAESPGSAPRPAGACHKAELAAPVPIEIIRR